MRSLKQRSLLLLLTIMAITLVALGEGMALLILPLAMATAHTLLYGQQETLHKMLVAWLLVITEWTFGNIQEPILTIIGEKLLLLSQARLHLCPTAPM